MSTTGSGRGSRSRASRPRSRARTGRSRRRAWPELFRRGSRVGDEGGFVARDRGGSRSRATDAQSAGSVAARRQHPRRGVGATGVSNRTWILDPIDGTNFFVRSDPNWRVQIALQEDDTIVLAVVDEPANSRRWWATLGGGTWEQTTTDGPRRLHISERQTVVPTMSYSHRPWRSGCRLTRRHASGQPCRWSTSSTATSTRSTSTAVRCGTTRHGCCWSKRRAGDSRIMTVEHAWTAAVACTARCDT